MEIISVGEGGGHSALCTGAEHGGKVKADMSEE